MEKKPHKDGFGSDADLAYSSVYNVENLAREIPALKNHPLYMIALAQVKATADRLCEEK